MYVNEKDLSEYSEVTGKLKYSDDKKYPEYSLMIFESTTAAAIDSSYHHFQYTESNCTYLDVVEELKSVGYELKFSSNSDNYYVLVSMDKEKFDRQLKKGR